MTVKGGTVRDVVTARGFIRYMRPAAGFVRIAAGQLQKMRREVKMTGTIALVGGDEFRRHCREMDGEIMQAASRHPARVVVIPTAAAYAGPEKAAQDGVTHFNSLGGRAESLMILDREQAEDADLVAGVAAADLIYFTGGNPNHLLDTLRDSRLLAAIRAAVEQGGILAGSSAGAMVMGSWMRRPRSAEWAPGLGLVPGTAILPHHENSNPAVVFDQLQSRLSDGLTVLGIDAQTGVLGPPGRWRVVGHGQVTVYQAGDWQVHLAGAVIGPIAK